MASKAWRKDRITSAVDEETGLRIVDLPTVKGLAKADRDALFAFEREHLSTTRAVIRMNKRFQNGNVIIPEDAPPARLVAAGIPEALHRFYA